MRLPFTHPSLAELSAFASGEQPSSVRARTSAHVARCPRCQDALRFLRRVELPAADVLPPASEALWTRISASRAAGVRTLLPAPGEVRTSAGDPASAPAGRVTNDPHVATATSVWRIVGAWAAVAVLFVGAMQVFAPADANAADSQGTLTLLPALPRPGETVRVRYSPAGQGFSGVSSVRLRARLRTPDNESYTVPPSNLRVLTTLTRTRGGDFEGRFQLPDSVVYAVLAVETMDSTTVDDNTGQGWELLVAAHDTVPLFASLQQRSEDMLGRSWEEGYAAAQRMTALYPDSVRAWTTREFYERQLFSGAVGDSIAAQRASTIDVLMEQAMRASRLSYHDMDAIYWRAYARANRPGATAQDTVTWERWWTRMLREQPRHEQVAQRLSVWMDVKRLGAVRAMDSLETLYATFAPLRTPAGRNVVNSGQYVADQLKDDTLRRRWVARALVGMPDSASDMAVFLASVPSFREEGMQQLRTLLRDPSLPRMVVRPLSRTAASQHRAVDDLRRHLYSALGRALVAGGNARAALDTLRLASEGAWDPASFAGLARSYLLAGDSLASMQMRARQVVDGRTRVTLRDSLDRAGRAQLGADAWEALLRETRREMHALLLERSISRSVASSARAQSRDGRDHTLPELTGRAPSLVIFWSRHCGYALEALPDIRILVERLRAAGTPVVFVIDEAPSADLDAYLAAERITWPVYYDARKRMGDAMRNFATPMYYVLDASQRIRFAPSVVEVGDLYGQLSAVQSEATP